MNLEPLDKTIHDRQSFDCGHAELNQYLKQTARQSTDKSLTRTRVLVDPDQPERIIGFFTLAPVQLNLPKDSSLAKRTKEGEVPAVLLARMGIDRRFQGNNHGMDLLNEAICWATYAMRAVGGIALVVEPKEDTQARSFYEKNGFLTLHEAGHDGGERLYLPIGSCEMICQALYE